ncbi:uncharacterized [Tachysurus ichikawai]
MCRLIWVEMTDVMRLPGLTVCTRTCSTRCLALRLRRIGDQLEIAWAANNNKRAERRSADRSGDVWLCGVHMICAAIHMTGLVLLITGRRHL